MPDAILTVNAGSSSLKLALVVGAGPEPSDGTIAASASPDPDDATALRAFVASAGKIDAVAHRVVHGGSRFVEPVVVDRSVRAALGELADLAPLHMPLALDAMDAVADAAPGLTAVACFDTAFHAGMPPAASTYALPAGWSAAWGLRRFGFHGLSHEWAASRVASLLGRPLASLRTVTCHLGAGSSLAAVANGRSVDTTMGFTPLEGLVMARRAGSVDPGLLVWLLRTGRVKADELDDTLERHSGLIGLTGTGDMREVLRRAADGDDAAALAVAVHDHRLRAGIASMAAAMGGIDAVVFTGGIGEHAPAVRAAACGGLAWLGVELDAAANRRADGDTVVSTETSRVAVAVVTAREDLVAAAGARRLLAHPSPATRS